MVENEYSKVKVNNEMDYCSVTDMDVKGKAPERILFFEMGETRLLCKAFLRF